MLITAMLLLCAIIVDARAQTQEKTQAKLSREERNKKLALSEAIDVVNMHCEKLIGKVTEPYSLRHDYITHYKDSDFDKKFTDAQKLDLLDYFKGRPDLPDFSFLISEYQTTIDRKNRIKFNAIQTLEVIEKLGFDENAYPFAENCKVKDFMAKSLNEILMRTAVAFGTKQYDLSYNLVRPEGFSWQIGDVQIDRKSIAEGRRRAYLQTISQSGFDKLIENLCNASSFSKLGCK